MHQDQPPLIDDAMLARVQARARNWRRMTIGALIGFTAAAVMILALGSVFPSLLLADERLLRNLVLFAGSVIGARAMKLSPEGV